MPTWITTALPYVAPVAIGLVTTAIGSTALTGRRLRNELVADAQIVDALPESSQALVREEMGRKSEVLVAVSRFPVLIPSDLLRLALLTCLSTWFGYLTYDVAVNRVIQDAVYFTPLGLWFNDWLFTSLTHSLNGRRVQRQAAIAPVRPVGFDARLGHIFADGSMLLLLMAVAGPPAMLIVGVVLRTQIPDGFALLPILGMSGYIWWVANSRMARAVLSL